MTDEEKLHKKEMYMNLQDKYRNNPVAFAEEMYGAKLYPYQKMMLNAMCGVDKVKQVFDPRKAYKRMMAEAQLEYMKMQELDFEIWKKDCIDVYEKGVLVKTIKHNKC